MRRIHDDFDKTEMTYEEFVDAVGLFYRISMDLIKTQYELAMAELHGATPEKLEATKLELSQ